MAGISKQERLKRIAYHEAGHALASIGSKRAFKDVTIIPGEGYLGLLTHNPWKALNPEMTSYTWEAKGVHYVRQEIFIFLAGPLAGHIYNGKPVIRHWIEQGDHYQAFFLLDSLYDGASHDDNISEEINRFLHYMEKSVENYLSLNWVFVERIASELLELGTLTYKQAKAVVFKDRVSSFAELAEMKGPIPILRDVHIL